MHDDGDWDSEVGEGLLELVGGPWWFVLLVLATSLGLLAYHYWGS